MQFESIGTADESAAIDRKLSVNKFKGAGRSYFAAAVKVIPLRKAVLEENLIGIILVRTGAGAGNNEQDRQKQ